jgi:glycosyltransferase involved in cell wall biosynthesis
VISDNHSEDGAWAFFEELAPKDARIFIAQAPREGMYANWNRCVERARGEYVYIATSDDTMAFDCLEKMVAALEQHKDCDLAHCPLVIIDHVGAPMANPRWPDCTAFCQGAKELPQRLHVRRAPYDGLLHLTRRHVYLSFTQLLIRRSLFSRIGGLPSKWGSIGDFNWEMKAGLVANTVYVPDTRATWRIHPKQATDLAYGGTAEYQQKVEEMILDAVAACEAHLPPAVLAGLRSHWLNWFRDIRTYYAGLRHRKNSFSRRLFQMSQLFNGTPASRHELIGQFFGKSKWDERATRTEILLWLESLGLGPIIEPESR